VARLRLAKRAASTHTMDKIANRLEEQPMPSDWKTERNALVRETMAFVANVSQHTPVSNLMAAADRSVDDVERRPLASIDRERAVIRQRVANFKALQQRLIREREAFATTALQHIRPRTSDRMEYSQMRAASTTA
jgi:hypothetical protein